MRHLMTWLQVSAIDDVPPAYPARPKRLLGSHAPWMRTLLRPMAVAGWTELRLQGLALEPGSLAALATAFPDLKVGAGPGHMHAYFAVLCVVSGPARVCVAINS